MARKYARDNRGRFATTAGGGATARGGRLKTASGGKRERQTMASSASAPAGAIKGKVNRDPNAMAKRGRGVNPAPSSKEPPAKPKRASRAKAKPQQPQADAKKRFRPGELMNANARPVGVVAKFKKSDDNFGTNRESNILRATADAQSRGLDVGSFNNAKTGTIAHGSMGGITLNEGAKFWANPRAEMRAMRRSGHVSTSNPRGLIAHEAGHAKDKMLTGSVSDRLWKSTQNEKLARRVSRYATNNSREFVAEVRAGLETGRKYDFQVMRAFRAESGLGAVKANRRPTKANRPKPKATRRRK